jgi:hypothetical protein
MANNNTLSYSQDKTNPRKKEVTKTQFKILLNCRDAPDIRPAGYPAG